MRDGSGVAFRIAAAASATRCCTWGGARHVDERFCSSNAYLLKVCNVVACPFCVSTIKRAAVPFYFNNAGKDLLVVEALVERRDGHDLRDGTKSIHFWGFEPRQVFESV